MSEELFDVVFFGILQPGRDKNTVMQNMAKLFYMDIEKLAPYFSGDRRVIKRNINAAKAKIYREALENVGLVIKIERCQPASNQSVADKAATQTETKTSANSEYDTGGFTLAPTGTDVLQNPVRVAAQPIEDISFLSMAEPGANIIENPVPVATQHIDDISDITMAEVGSNILEYPVTITARKIDDISDISMAETGADLVADPAPEVKANIPDFSALSLCNE